MATKIMYFMAQWCGPCKAYKPKFQALAEQNKDKATFELVDIDDASELSMQLGIRGVPTVIIFEDDKEVKRAVGGPQIDKTLEFLKD